MKDTPNFKLHLLTRCHGVGPGDVCLLVEEREAADVLDVHPAGGTGWRLLGGPEDVGVRGSGGCCQHEDTHEKPHGDCGGEGCWQALVGALSGWGLVH